VLPQHGVVVISVLKVTEVVKLTVGPMSLVPTVSMIPLGMVLDAIPTRTIAATNPTTTTALLLSLVHDSDDD